ncbi:TrbC/VirB2 family protein [Candidatus Saccharibacteria bacterium]|nr:MAG: TrbC/VirB2 family protein [Candidatus Saccharibacteria bacterium]
MKHSTYRLGIFTVLISGMTLLSVLALFPRAAHAQAALSPNQQAVCEAIGSGAGCDQDAGGGTKIDSVVSTVITIFTAVIGIVAVIMIIVAGFKYITSGGDSSKLTSAKNTLVYALIGLVIVALAQGIVKFVLNRATRTVPTCSSNQVVDDKTNTCVTKPKKS